jgi:hypothetical protein
VIAVASIDRYSGDLSFAKGNTPRRKPYATKLLEEGICLISSNLDTFRLSGILYRVLLIPEDLGNAAI